MRKVIGNGIAKAVDDLGADRLETFEVYEDDIERWIEINHAGISRKTQLSEALNHAVGHQQMADFLWRQMIRDIEQSK